MKMNAKAERIENGQYESEAPRSRVIDQDRMRQIFERETPSPQTQNESGNGTRSSSQDQQVDT
jgi:hypothetical protein